MVMQKEKKRKQTKRKMVMQKEKETNKEEDGDANRKEKGQIRNKLCAPWGNKSNQGLWQARSTLDTYNKR